MNKEFIPYEQALELKSLGFNYQCFAAQKDNLIDYGSEMYDFIYNADLTDKTDGWVALPLYQQAFRWFREKGFVNSVRSHNDKCHEYYLIHNGKASQSWNYSTYEYAELACLKTLIEIAKNK